MPMPIAAGAAAIFSNIEQLSLVEIQELLRVEAIAHLPLPSLRNFSKAATMTGGQRRTFATQSRSVVRIKSNRCNPVTFRFALFSPAQAAVRAARTAVRVFANIFRILRIALFHLFDIEQGVVSTGKGKVGSYVS